MRLAVTAALLLCAAWSDAWGQTEMVWGRDYTFERMVATRAVHDARDSGSVNLVAYVYRPLRQDRRQVVLYSHGSSPVLWARQLDAFLKTLDK